MLMGYDESASSGQALIAGFRRDFRSSVGPRADLPGHSLDTGTGPEFVDLPQQLGSFGDVWLWASSRVSSLAAASDAKSTLSPHSITSSASCWSCVGISTPSAVAVLRLITRSNLSGRCIGNSLGLAPCRIFPT